MYGKVFDSMFTGSLYGSGALSFAVWSYVIANMVPGDSGACYLELNPKLLGPILGEPVEQVGAMIERFCQPDPESRSQEEEGRRLVKEGQFLYRVVNGAKYREMRSAENRREYNRMKQREYRAKVKAAPVLAKNKKLAMKGSGTLAERLAVQAAREGDQGLAERVAESQAKRAGGMEPASPAQKEFRERMAKTIEEAEREAQAAEERLAAAGGMEGTPQPPEGAEGVQFPEV